MNRNKEIPDGEVTVVSFTDILNPPFFSAVNNCEQYERMPCMIREIVKNDLDGLLRLYRQLHDNSMPEKTAELLEIWDDMIQDKNHHVIVAEEKEGIVSSCVCIIIPNLTHNQRPYAFIENVITNEKFRKRGLATQCLNFAKEIALKENCYKMMLLTGSRKKSTLDFYKKAGYNSDDKTAFIQWI